jgi:hypothetical protein
MVETEAIDYSGGYDLTNDIDIDDNFIQRYDDIAAIDYVIVDNPIAPKYRKKSKIKRNISIFENEENSHTFVFQHILWFL